MKLVPALFRSANVLEIAAPEQTRLIPLHVMAVKVGKSVCEVLPATHALTSCDISSKFGTKAAGINAEPVLYLKDFGRAHTDVQDCVQNAERSSWYRC